MPILTTPGLAPADDALDVEKHYTPTFGEYLKAVWDDTANDDPMTLGANLRREQEARYGVDVYTVAEEGGLTGGLEALRETAPLPAMPLEEQKTYIKEEGLEGQLSPGEHYTPEELEFLARLKHEELDRKLTREQAPGWMAPFGFAAGLAESMTDPLNLATSFVPVVGEARVMSLLGKTGSAWGRAGVRAGVGAIEGAVGAALVEPVVAGAKSALQQDYGFADSLMNVAFGAGMGAVLHPLTGAFGDFTRARKGQRQPWEYVPSTDTTEQLRAGNAQSIWRGMRESGSEHLSPEHAEAAAALWDATLRGYAYDTGELVEDLYRHYRVEYRGGKLEVLPAAAEADGRTARLAEMFKDMTDTTEKMPVPDGDEDEAKPAAPDAPEAVAADAAADGRAVEEAGAVDGMAPEEAVVSPAAPVGEEGAGASRRALGLPNEKGDALYQGKAASLDEAQARLARDVAAWEKTVDGIVAEGRVPSSPVLMLKQTPLVFQLLGTDTVTGRAAAEGGIYAAPHVFDGTHPNMTPEMWKQIPRAMTDPIAVFDSDSPTGRAKGDLVFMLEVQDANGATVVVPVALNVKGKSKAHINIVKSAYAKEKNGKPSSAWFVKQAQKNARYINGQKWAFRASAPGSNSPLVAPQRQIHRRTNAHGNTIYTEADLVNVKKQFPGNYQRAVASPENGGTVITVRGDELGVPEGADLKEYQKAAREVYRKLQKTPAQREDLGEIRFTSVGFGKMIISGADPRKWKLVPRLKELIEKADYITRRELNKKRKDDIVVFHWLEGNVDLDGERLRVGFQIGEDSKGNKFYNLNQDLEKWERRYKKTEDQRQSNSDFQKRKTPDRTDIGFGGQELFQDASASIENTITTSTDGVNLYILSEGAQGEAPRARVSFGEQDAYAVVEFFKAADPSSAPHEMYHIFRRIMSELYDDPRASEASKERYRKACEFVGAEPGKVWTPEQEEKFARAGERFLLEGVAPNARMHDVMEAFRQWMGEIYGNAERSGLEISDGMRKVFGDMLGTAEDGDLNFRYAMGQILDYHPERGIDTTFEAPAYSTPEQALEAYTADASARMDEAFNALADKPEVQEQFRQEYAAALADADAVIADARTMAQIRQAAAACVMRG